MKLSLAISATSLPFANLSLASSQEEQVRILPIMPSEDSDLPRLTDILGTQRSLTSFFSFSRIHASTEDLLSSLTHNVTVLAPLNSAIDSLPRKPWENPTDYQKGGVGAYEGGEGEQKANENLKRFVEGHLVVSDGEWKAGQKKETIGGREIWWEEKDEGRVVMPDKVDVEKVGKRVANGEVWILKGVLNYL